ncbi:MAG: response regulator [Planctomycetes bacterium]|jgi:DNA-binding response OmpR family regulator|nr:response regulator transcription factor [Phycisphaerae bacterium]NBB94432.1 response regulator [Planctomycetota bacterium]
MGSDKPLIMVVEDDAEMNQLQRELLAIHGMDSVPAYSGTEALAVDADRKPDAILLDVMLPELDGFETCIRLREKQQRSVPVIMLTAMDSDECRQRGFAAGADAYFIKPFDPDDVIKSLHVLLAKNQ